MSEPLRLDPRTRRWLKQEVSRRRKEKELHVGRPVLHRYSKQGDRDTVEHSPDATAVFDSGGAEGGSEEASPLVEIRPGIAG